MISTPALPGWLIADQLTGEPEGRTVTAPPGGSVTEHVADLAVKPAGGPVVAPPTGAVSGSGAAESGDTESVGTESVGADSAGAESVGTGAGAADVGGSRASGPDDSAVRQTAESPVPPVDGHRGAGPDVGQAVPKEAEQAAGASRGIPRDTDHPSEVADHPDGTSPEQEPDNPVNPSPPRGGSRVKQPPSRTRRTGSRPRPGSVAVAAAATGGWAATVSFAPVLVVVLFAWFGSSTVSGGTAVRFAATAWLLGHGVPFTAPHGQVGLVPLGITALAVWRLVRAGAHTARAVAAAPRDVPYVVGAVAVTYGLIGFIAGIVANTAAFTVAPWQALLITAVVGALASLPGAMAETGAARQIWHRWPDPLREGVRGGAIAALWVLAAGAAVAGLATALAYPDAADLYRGYGVGVAGGAGITLVGLVYAPNLAVWGAAYLVGPGFGFGVGTEVTVFDVSLGALPAVPVLAGLPSGPAPAAVGVLLAVPVLAGMLVGVRTARDHPRLPWPAVFTASAITGLVAGGVLAAASFAASGPLGSGHLAQIGPSWWLVGLVAAGVVAVGTAIGAASARALAVRRPGR